MQRRSAIAALLAAARRARAGASLAPFFEGRHGAAVVLDVQSARAVAIHDPELASKLPLPPGSTLKPFVLAALVESGKLRPAERWPCAGELTIAGRSMACSHPPLAAPVDMRAAIAYSCNNFVAHFAERFAEGELPLLLARYGVEPGPRPRDPRLLALGEDGILVTLAALAEMYRRFALRANRAALAPIVGGMEDAVEYGTAQRARVPGLRVAGKTGSVVSPDGAHRAWFAGFAPGQSPKVVVAVMLQARSGGADAAPVAGRILDAYSKGAL